MGGFRSEKSTSRGSGFLWFLSFYLKLAAARKRSPERKRLLLIDEPGSYLHARAQKDVLHLFEDRIVPDDQVIYSTHSPYLMPGAPRLAGCPMSRRFCETWDATVALRS